MAHFSLNLNTSLVGGTRQVLNLVTYAKYHVVYNATIIHAIWVKASIGTTTHALIISLSCGHTSEPMTLYSYSVATLLSKYMEKPFVPIL